MGKIIRRCIAALLCITAIILILIPSRDASATTTKGDFELDGSTLVAYLGNDTDVTLPNTITAIGDDAFSKNKALYKIVVPDSVKSIGHAAFEGCINLTYATLGSSIKSIGSAAFSGCKNLQSVNIPERCNDLGSGVFAGCTSLSSVSIDSNNRNYICVDGVIYSKDGSKLVQYLGGRPSASYSMPSTVSNIGEYAFWGADSLNSATVSGQVKEIPEYAFSNCASLSKVVLPTSVESLMAFSFADCPALNRIKIPDSVGYIDEKAFYLTNRAMLEFVNDEGDTTKTVATSSVEDIADDTNSNTTDNTDSGNDIAGSNDLDDTDDNTITDLNNSNGYTPSLSGTSNWVKLINSRDFSDNKSQNELGSGMIVGGNALFIMNSDMPVKGYDLDDAEAEDNLASSGGNTSLRGDTFEIIDGVLASYNGNDENVIIPDSVNKIGERAFYKNENIKSVKIPSSVTEIDDFAFARTNLSDIDIPSTVKRIGYAAFYQCSELSNVNIPESVDQIELGAFDGSKWYYDWNNSQDGNSYLVVGNGILLGYKGDGGNISLPEGTKQVAAGCFDSNESITGVSIPTGVFRIGEDAFNACINLSTLTMPEGLIDIEDRAFGNTSLKTVHIPDSVKSIGLGAFDTSGNGNTLKTVLFNGIDVPNVSYKDTATRLSGQDLRKDALNGVENVIVQSDCNLDSGTLFNPKYYGFHGQIYCVSPDSTDEQGMLSLLKTLKKPDSSGNVNIDSHVTIGKEEYVMNGVKEHAFDPYITYYEWCETRPNKVMVSGNVSADLNSLLNNITSKIENVETSLSGIKVQLDGEQLIGEGHASITDCNEPLTLIISQEEGNRDSLMRGLYSFYGGDTNVTMLPLELTLFDKTGTLLIHKFGDSKMDVSIVLPSMFMNSDSVKVASLDNDGVLTELPTGIESINGNKTLNFVANHCSKYAIYIKNETTVLKTEDNGGEGTDYIPDEMPFQGNDETSDMRHGRNEIDESGIVEITQINNSDEAEGGILSDGGILKTINKSDDGKITAKWFIIVILFALAAILVLYKPARKK